MFLKTNISSPWYSQVRRTKSFTLFLVLMDAARMISSYNKNHLIQKLQSMKLNFNGNIVLP